MEEDIIEKGIKASLDFTADEIRSHALKIKARELGFLPDDSELVDLREIAKSKEMKLYRKHFTDKTHQKLAKTGIWLRKNEGKDEKVMKCLDKIRKDHKKKGVLIVALIQNGIIFNLIQRLVMNEMKPKEIKEKLKILLDDVERYATLVSNQDKEEEIIKKLDIRLKSLQPDLLILFGSGNAVKKLDKIVKALKIGNSDYFSFTYEEDATVKKKSIFLCRDTD